MPDSALHTLQEVFGYKQFRGHQAAVIESLLAGRDALVLMPTGGGKSLCYQIPALLREGAGLVVSPLIALMQDQVRALDELGIEAAFLNSSLSQEEQGDVIRRLKAGEIQLLYVAPERLLQPRTQSLLAQIPLALIAIDEAHCVSQWGHDFRQDYLALDQLRELFPGVPRMATAAGTPNSRATLARWPAMVPCSEMTAAARPSNTAHRGRAALITRMAPSGKRRASISLRTI